MKRLDCQENVTNLALKIHDALVDADYLVENDNSFELIHKVIDEFAGYPDYNTQH